MGLRQAITFYLTLNIIKFCKILHTLSVSLNFCLLTEAHERLMDIYERLDDMDSDKAEVKAAELLNGTLHLFNVSRPLDMEDQPQG